MNTNLSSQTDTMNNNSHHTNTQSFFTRTRKALLATARVNVNDEYGNIHILRVIKDSGSKACLITKAPVKKLNFKQQITDTEVSGLSEVKQVTSTFTSIHNNFKMITAKSTN